MKLKKPAFTLIELLVVIVIIGILATIAVSTFSGYFAKARDAKRITQFKQTVDLLKQYVSVNEKLPHISHNGSPAACGGWMVNNKSHHGSIIELEKKYGLKLKENYWDGNCRGFRIYIYRAGSSNCPLSKGRFLVFVSDLEQMVSGDETLDSLGLEEYKFSCSGGHNWNSSQPRALVFGIFENGDTGPQ